MVFQWFSPFSYGVPMVFTIFLWFSGVKLPIIAPSPLHCFDPLGRRAQRPEAKEILGKWEGF
jgi:hypothetical protein